VTRKKPPAPPPWAAIAGYGEPGDMTERVVLPPEEYRARYEVLVVGRLTPDPFASDLVTVRDRQTGAVLRFVEGRDVQASLPRTLTQKAMAPGNRFRFNGAIP